MYRTPQAKTGKPSHHIFQTVKRDAGRSLEELVDVSNSLTHTQRRKSKRKRAATPDLNVNVAVDAEEVPLEEEQSTRKVSTKATRRTAKEDEKDYFEFVRRREAKRERDDREMFLGLKSFKGSQRGWDGKPEAERRKAEDLRREEDRLRSPPPSRGLRPYHRRVSAKELEASFEAHQSREFMKQLAAEDLVTLRKERNHNEMVKVKWDFDAIKQAALEDRYDKEDRAFRRAVKLRKRSDTLVESVEFDEEDDLIVDEESRSPTLVASKKSVSCTLESAGSGSFVPSIEFAPEISEEKIKRIDHLVQPEETPRYEMMSEDAESPEDGEITEDGERLEEGEIVEELI